MLGLFSGKFAKLSIFMLADSFGDVSPLKNVTLWWPILLLVSLSFRKCNESQCIIKGILRGSYWCCFILSRISNCILNKNPVRNLFLSSTKISPPTVFHRQFLFCFADDKKSYLELPQTTLKARLSAPNHIFFISYRCSDC